MARFISTSQYPSASQAQVDSSTSGVATAYVSPNTLAASPYYGRKVLQAVVVDFVTDVAILDSQFFLLIPAGFNGMNLVAIQADVITAGTTVIQAQILTIQIRNVTQGADMLTTLLTVDSGETSSATAATPAVIDTANDDVATNDLLRIDVDDIHTTAPKGLIVTLSFQLPTS